MTKVLFRCAAITTFVFVSASLITSLLAGNSTDGFQGTQFNHSKSYDDGLDYVDPSGMTKDPTLLLVQVVFRHGDRSPIYSYPTDIHKDEWPKGYGQLTRLGMMQGYQLGQYLRKQYSGFLREEYLPEEVYIRSTNEDRTIMTAQSVAAGLFPYHSKSDETWHFGYWQPIPVHTVPKQWDKMLRPNKACNYVNDLKYGLKAYFYSKQSIMKNKVMMFALSEYSGLEMNFTTLHYLADTIFCQKVHNMSMPEWLRKDIEVELISFYNRLPVLMPEEAKYLAGILLETLIDNMKSKAKSTLDKHKLYLYSAHEGNLHTLTSLLGVFHQEMVLSFGSALIIELHSIHDQLFVKLLLKTPDDAMPKTLNAFGCKYDLCPLHLLSNIFDEPAQKSWDEMCGKTSNDRVIDFGENTIPILVAVMVIFIALDLFLLYKVFIYRQQLGKHGKTEAYSLVRTDGDSSSSDDDDTETMRRRHGHTTNNNMKNGGGKINRSNHARNGKSFEDIEHCEDWNQEETSIFLAPSKGRSK